MKQIKKLPKIFLVCIEILLLFFILRKGIKAREACYCDDGDEPGGLAIVCYDCSGGGIRDCHLSLSGCPAGGCFTGDTKIATPSGEKEIQNVKEGDVVKSFSVETGEIREATVSNVHKRQVSGYYLLKTESGKEIKVTGEHPILAVKQEDISNNQINPPLLKATEGHGKSISNDKLQIIKEVFENIWEKVKGMIR